MATINVKKPFIHNTPAGHVPYVPGLIDVPDEVANHWYVRSHADIIDGDISPVEKSNTKNSDKDNEIAALMAAFEAYSPELPLGQKTRKKGKQPKV